MPAGIQQGKNVLLKLGDGATPTEAFTVIGALRSNSLTINRENIDITTKDSNYWQELMSGGVGSVEVNGGMLYKSDDSVQNDLIDLAFADDNKANFQFFIPGGTGEAITIEGSFLVTSCAPVESSEYNGEVAMSITLASNGKPTLTRA